MTHSISVGMGEIKVSADRDAELLCLGLGSCIAICAYAPRQRIAGMAHVVLPGAPNEGSAPSGKYAQSAIPLLLAQMRELGARAIDLRVALVGGAAIFASSHGTLDIGQRNIEAVRNGLRKARLTAVREEVGGRESRTVMLPVATGQMRLRTLRGGISLLADLGHL